MIIVLEHSLPAEYECLCQFDTGEEFPANLIVSGAFLSSTISISHASTIFRLSLAFAPFMEDKTKVWSPDQDPVRMRCTSRRTPRRACAAFE